MWASLVVQLVKNLPEMQETPVRFLGWVQTVCLWVTDHTIVVIWFTKICFCTGFLCILFISQENCVTICNRMQLDPYLTSHKIQLQMD